MEDPSIQSSSRMTENSDTSEAGNLPRDLLIKLQLAKTWNLTTDEEEILKSCLETDPRTEVLILRCLEFAENDEYLDPSPISILIEKRKGLGPLRLMLRLAACRTSPVKRGECTLAAMWHLDALGEGERIERWFFLRAVGMKHFELEYRDEPMGGYITFDAFDWVYRRAFDCQDLVPLLFADGKRTQTRRKELLNILARQTGDFLQDYDLGDLEVSLQKLKESLGGISDPAERAELCESKLGLGRHEAPYKPPADLTSEEVSSLKQTAEADQWRWWEALASICARAELTPDLKEWLLARLGRVGSQEQSWTSVICRCTRDQDLARTALEHLLQEPGRIGLGGCIGRFCSGSWKLPPHEGMNLIRRALGVECANKLAEQEERAKLWNLLITAYGDHVTDFTDLLLEVKTGRFQSWRAGSFLTSLYERGLHRVEIRQMVERGFEPPYQSDLPLENRLRSPSLLTAVESPLAWELWLKVAKEWPERGERVDAMGLLASHGGAKPEFIGLLRSAAHEEDEYVRFHARRLLEAYSPDDVRNAEFAASGATAAQVRLHGTSDGFDDEGFQRWNDKAEDRRWQLMSGLSDGSDESVRGHLVHALAYWFGDHPETLSFLIDYVRRPTRPPEQFASTGSPLAWEENWKRERLWKEEPGLREYCLKVLGHRWPAEESVHELAKWALDHPWKPLRDEAARILARDHAASSDTVELLAKHMGGSDVVFEEYVALMRRDPLAMRRALAVLAALGDSDGGPLAFHGPELLSRAYGPRKDLKAALEELGAATANEVLRKSITHLFEDLW